jgi:thymidylate synthase (FAD)
MTPRVFILARPCFDSAHQQFLNQYLPAGHAEWRESAGATAAERIVEFAGRVCYMSFGPKQSDKSNRDYIRNLIRNGHESVLEHAVWTIAIHGISRAFSHQLVRHRVGFAFSQLSQQYHDESEARFVRPAGIDNVPEAAEIWDRAIESTQTAYRRILAALDNAHSTATPDAQREVTRALRSAARSVLPNARETALVMTVNARALRNFLKLRGGIIGDAEMRCVAAALLNFIRPEGPALFEDFTVHNHPDGLPLVLHRDLE